MAKLPGGPSLLTPCRRARCTPWLRPPRAGDLCWGPRTFEELGGRPRARRRLPWSRLPGSNGIIIWERCRHRMPRSVVFGLQTSAQGSANKFSPLLQGYKRGRRFLVELYYLRSGWWNTAKHVLLLSSRSIALPWRCEVNRSTNSFCFSDGNQSCPAWTRPFLWGAHPGINEQPFTRNKHSGVEREHRRQRREVLFPFREEN